MVAGETGVTEQDNRRGFYCGPCHDGHEAFAREEKVPAARAATKHCDRCHSYGKMADLRFEFYEFTKKFPKQRFGCVTRTFSASRKVPRTTPCRTSVPASTAVPATERCRFQIWVASAAIRSCDEDGASVSVPPPDGDRDGHGVLGASIASAARALWRRCDGSRVEQGGCAGRCVLSLESPDTLYLPGVPHRARLLRGAQCHPEIFNIKKKTTEDLTMEQILKGESCGVCHGKVAFPVNNCQSCHPSMWHIEY